jgi:C4-dicarboxylate transporter DctQ subunit
MLGIEMEDLPLPKWIAHSILFIGMALIAIRILILLWSIATGKDDGFNLTDEAKESMHLADEALTSSTFEGGKSV